MVSVVSDDRQTIGSFIRQQRMRAHPGDFPSLAIRRRHVHHLTQDDLAELAGLSVAVVAQIETGRYENLNPGVISRLAEALRLNWEQEQYLLNFLQAQPSHEPSASEITDGIRSVVDQAEPNPAILMNARFNILYWNSAATKLLGNFDQMPEPQRNVLWSMFSLPQMREVWERWETNARNMVAGFKMVASRNPAWRPSMHQLADELCTTCPDFARFWREEVPAMQPVMEKTYNHPHFGSMHVFQTVTEIAGSPDLSYIILTPADTHTRSIFENM